MAGRLYVDFCGEERRLDCGETLSFGRDADLEIDDNPYLHRVLGRFEHREGHWWVDNCGGSIAINVYDRGSCTNLVIAPGGTAALTMADLAVAFVAGRTRYELDAAVQDAADPVELLEVPDDSERTLEWGVVELNADQHLLLVDMAARHLEEPNAADLSVPAKAECAARLGWSLSKYNRKLDHLCAKLARAGVGGLQGGTALAASDRRRRLIDHAIAVGLVVPEDLELLAARR